MAVILARRHQKDRMAEHRRWAPQLQAKQQRFKQNSKKGDKQAQKTAALANLNRMLSHPQGQGGVPMRPAAATPEPSSAPPSVPRTVPRAPQNDTSFLIAQEAGEHRGKNWTNGYQDLDQDTAALGIGLNYFGTNEGLVRRREGASDSEGEDRSEPDDYELHLEGTVGDTLADADAPEQLRARLDDQAAKICSLEEQNLNLQERLYLLEQELAEARRTTPSGHESEDEAASGDVVQDL